MRTSGWRCATMKELLLYAGHGAALLDVHVCRDAERLAGGNIPSLETLPNVWNGSCSSKTSPQTNSRSSSSCFTLSDCWDFHLWDVKLSFGDDPGPDPTSRPRRFPGSRCWWDKLQLWMKQGPELRAGSITSELRSPWQRQVDGGDPPDVLRLIWVSLAMKLWIWAHLSGSETSAAEKQTNKQIHFNHISPSQKKEELVRVIDTIIHTSGGRMRLKVVRILSCLWFICRKTFKM